MTIKRLACLLTVLLFFAVCIRLACSPALQSKADSLFDSLGSSVLLARLVYGGDAVPVSTVSRDVSPAPGASPYAAADPVSDYGESAATPSPEPDPEPVLTTPAVSLSANNELMYHPPEKGADMDILNRTSYIPDIAALLGEDAGFSVSESGPQVLIVHTHGSEAYLGSDSARSTDTSQNVVAVGDVLASELAARGLNVLHDRNMYDYPAYSGSYSRSLEAVQDQLSLYPELKIVIDLHRDSLTGTDGDQWASHYDRSTAQVMLIATNGENGLSHPNWLLNFRFALRLQAAMNEKYPGLARPLCLSGERYNQHAAPGYLILEVGTDGNTISEAENAVRLFADCAAEVIASLLE